MKLRNKLFYIFIFVFMCVQILAQNTNPVVSNVIFSITGTTVTVTYDVSDAAQSSVTIIMKVSNDCGATWDYNYGAVSGDIGASVSTGTGKTITWTYNGGFEENFKMKIIANDETADGSPCPGTPTVLYSGKTYNTLQIGDQCWLKENLDVGTRIDGSGDQTNNSTIEKYCYGDNTNDCDTYGGLYKWNEAMKYVTTEGTQGICPDGWHLPTLGEFGTLQTAVINNGNTLKAIGQGSGDGAGTNTSGFSALLAGHRRINGLFDNLGVHTSFWSSTDYDAMHANKQEVNNSSSIFWLGNDGKDYGLSVRCVKD